MESGDGPDDLRLWAVKRADGPDDLRFWAVKRVDGPDDLRLCRLYAAHSKRLVSVEAGWFLAAVMSDWISSSVSA